MIKTRIKEAQLKLGLIQTLIRFDLITQSNSTMLDLSFQLYELRMIEYKEQFMAAFTQK